MGDRDEIRSWATLGLAVVSVVGLLWERRSRVALRPKNPTHKIVCRCACMAQDPDNPNVYRGDYQTFEERADCGSLKGITCSTEHYGEGKLEGCDKRSVETGLKPQRLQEVRPVVRG